MHPKRNARRLLPWSLALVAGMSAPGHAAPPKQAAPTAGEVTVDKTGALLVPLGALVTFDLKLGKDEILTDVFVTREDILQVRIDPNKADRLLLTGKAAGLTQMTLAFKDRPRR